MGDMTRAQLLVQGGVASTNDEMTLYVRQWLDSWLKRTAASWSWPQLKELVADVPVAAGVASVDVGLGDGGVDYYIHKLLGETVIFRNGGYTNSGIMYVRQLLSADPLRDHRTMSAARRTGTPTTVKVKEFGPNSDKDRGQLRLYLDPVPSEALYLSFDAHVIPAAIGTSSTEDDEYPWYPADRTLEQAVKCAFMEQDDGAEGKENLQGELLRLDAMVTADRDFYGSQAGDNEMMMLDPGVFR